MAEWYEGIEGVTADDVAHVQTKGWDMSDPAKAFGAALKAYRGVETFVGHPADQIIKLPKDATDPTYQSAYDRVVGMSAPKALTDYTLDDVKFKDGSPLDDADKKFVSELAFQLKLPVAAARQVAAAFAARAEAIDAEETAANGLLRQSNGVALRQAWGADYDAKAFAASKAADAGGLPKALLDFIETLPAPEYVQAQNALYSLGQTMNEAAMLRGGSAPGNPNGNLTLESATERLNSLKNDPSWRADYFAGKAEAIATFNQLTAIIARGRVGA